MHPHLPTDTTLLIASPIIGIVLGVLAMVIIDRALARRGHGIIASILGFVFLLVLPIAGIAVPFLA